MEYTHVGRLGLVVSRLCLGTMNFGPHTSEEDSHTILDTAVAYGINFVDTADGYTNGQSLAGSAFVYLGVFADNSDAIGVYQRSGFQQVGSSCPDMLLW